MAPEAMPRAHSLQDRHAPSDPMAEEPLCDSEAMRRFAGIGPGDDCIPDETAILNLYHLPERHGLTETIFADVNARLTAVVKPGNQPPGARPGRSSQPGGHLGAAESVDQMFLKYTGPIFFPGGSMPTGKIALLRDPVAPQPARFFIPGKRTDIV